MLNKKVIHNRSRRYIFLYPARKYIREKDIFSDYQTNTKYEEPTKSQIKETISKSCFSLQSIVNLSTTKVHKKVQIIQIPHHRKNTLSGLTNLHKHNSSDHHYLPDVFNLSSSSGNINENTGSKVKESITGNKNDSMISLNNNDEIANEILIKDKIKSIKKPTYVSKNNFATPQLVHNHSVHRSFGFITQVHKDLPLSPIKKGINFNETEKISLGQKLIINNHKKQKYLKYVEEKLFKIRENFIKNNISELRGNKQLLRQLYDPLKV